MYPCQHEEVGVPDRNRRRRALALTALVPALVVALATAARAASTVTVTITATGFSPSSVTVPVGTAIRWLNDTQGPVVVSVDGGTSYDDPVPAGQYSTDYTPTVGKHTATATYTPTHSATMTIVAARSTSPSPSPTTSPKPRSSSPAPTTSSPASRTSSRPRQHSSVRPPVVAGGPPAFPLLPLPGGASHQASSPGSGSVPLVAGSPAVTGAPPPLAAGGGRVIAEPAGTSGVGLPGAIAATLIVGLLAALGRVLLAEPRH
jgi:plastocyanin